MVSHKRDYCMRCERVPECLFFQVFSHVVFGISHMHLSSTVSAKSVSQTPSEILGK